MSNDNSDLLGSAAPAPKIRKRPVKPAAAPDAPVALVGEPTGVNPVVPAGTIERATDVETPTDAYTPPVEPAPLTAAEMAALEAKLKDINEAAQAPQPELITEPNADGSASVVLPELSPEYRIAMAARQPGRQRKYAYQRLLREGKKL